MFKQEQLYTVNGEISKVRNETRIKRMQKFQGNFNHNKDSSLSSQASRHYEIQVIVI